LHLKKLALKVISMIYTRQFLRGTRQKTRDRGEDEARRGEASKPEAEAAELKTRQVINYHRRTPSQGLADANWTFNT